MQVVLLGLLSLAHADPVGSLVEAEQGGLRGVEPRAIVAAPTVVLRGGTVLTATGERHEPGYVVLKGGLVDAVGAGEPPAVDGAVIVDVSDRFVTPGLIDAHSHLGVYPSPGARAHGDGNEATAPTTAGVWAEHSFWPQDPGLERAIAGGVTTLMALPGSANLIGGRGVVVHVVPHRGSRAMRLEGAPETVKMACGENPKRVYGERHSAPSTRMGSLRGTREAFLEAVEYQRDWQAYDEKLAKYEEAKANPPKKSKGAPPEEPRPPARDLDKETVVGILDGRFLAEVHCYRADDMLSFLQVADEFGFEVRSFHHAIEAYKIRDVLAGRNVSVSTWADWWGFKLEAYDGIPENAAFVHEAGGRAVIHSDSAIGIQRLNQEAAKAYHAGLHAGVELTEDDALRWITANAAWTLGVDDQIGTIEPGKRADLVVWSGPPLSVYSRADLVFVDGILRWDAARPAVWSDFVTGQEVR